MLFDPFLGFPLGKKLAEKVQGFVRPRHLDAPISFQRNRFQHYGAHESPSARPMMRRSAEIFNESATGVHGHS
jgi:hypothetical protein